MAFLNSQYNNNSVVPWVGTMPAAAGSYTVGQLLNVSGGKLTAITAALATTPPYVCNRTGTVTDGEPLPVSRISDDIIYETTLSAAAAGADVGVKLQVSAGGTQVSTGAGTFEIAGLTGTAAGDTVWGRWV